MVLNNESVINITKNVEWKQKKADKNGICLFDLLNHNSSRKKEKKEKKKAF